MDTQPPVSASPAAPHPGSPKPWVAQRLDLPCKLAGFEPPPCHVQLKFLPLGEQWTVLAMTGAGKLPGLVDWMKRYRPAELHVAPGLAPRTLRARFQPIPPTWERVLCALTVQYVELTTHGSASIFVEDPPERVKRFVHGTHGLVSAVRVRRTLAGAERPRLTPRQHEILTLAVALGYYELPHKLNLRTLAGKMGISVGAASELLRRGESAIVTSYMDCGIGAHWAEAVDGSAASRAEPAVAAPAPAPFAPGNQAPWQPSGSPVRRANDPDSAVAL